MQNAQEPHGCFAVASCFWQGAHVWDIPPQIAQQSPHVQEGPLQPPAKGDTAACVPQAMHSVCTAPGEFVARMARAAEPDTCTNIMPPQKVPHGQDFHMGKEGIVYAGKQDVSAPSPIWPRGQTVWKDACCSLYVESKLLLRDVLQGLFTRPAISLVLCLLLLLLPIPGKRHNLPNHWKTKPQQGMKDTSDVGCSQGFPSFQKDPTSTGVPGGVRDCTCMGFNWPMQTLFSAVGTTNSLYSKWKETHPMHTLESFWMNPYVKSGSAQVEKSRSSFKCLCTDVWCSRTQGMWTEHFKLGETKLIMSCNLGFDITNFNKTEWDWDSDTSLQMHPHAQHAFLPPWGELQASEAGITMPVFSDHIQFRTRKACPEIDKQPSLHSVTEVGRRGNPSYQHLYTESPVLQIASPLVQHSRMHSAAASTSSAMEAATSAQTLATQPCWMVEVGRELIARKFKDMASKPQHLLWRC